MDRSNLDDSSAFYGLGHSAIIDKRRSEREAYILEFDIKGKASRLIGYYQALGMRKIDAEEAGVERFLSLAAGVYDRMWRFIESGRDLDAAVLSAEAEMTKEADIEEEALDDESQERAAKDAYLGASLDDLMDIHKPTKGGGSKSKSYKTVKRPDATVVENALRKEMAA